jgi:hypothetical protein
MRSEIIQIVACDNYDGFQGFRDMFSQDFILLIWGLFNDETNPRAKLNGKLNNRLGQKSLTQLIIFWPIVGF